MFGGGGSRGKKSDLDQRLELVEGGGDALVHTPSVAADLAGGMAERDAAKSQRLREQVRIIDAQIADAKAGMIRQRVLRGPSGRRFECDADCIVGGCSETFAEEDGVLCGTGCQLFLCNVCFGSIVVTNECQVSGRYDKTVDAEGDGGLASAPGSLCCPLFPSDCSCGHIPLATIQRALLHESNRGPDGHFEDIESPGLSPHKIFLIARRRQAETKLSREGGEGAAPRLRESTLVRTVTEARHITSGLSRTLSANTLMRMSSSTFKSSVRAALADKVDELEQLRDELRSSVDTPIPAELRRICAQCCGEFASFEGAQCAVWHNDHFLCNICFGGYMMSACSRGGVYEQNISNRDGMVVSPMGSLPCPFFRGHEKILLVREPVSAAAAAAAATEARRSGVDNPLSTGTQLPDQDCRCSAIDLSTIEQALMDPRNSSVPYWRERKAGRTIDAQAAAQGISPADQAPTGDWSWGVEWLSRGWTPSAVHETARLRVAVEKDREEQRHREATSATSSGEVDTLAELSQKVDAALTKGASIQCPSCGVQAVKDDACIHMDSCPCRAAWCFLCGRLSGDADEGKCPRGRGGCDEKSYYLEAHDGWGSFNLPGENPAFGAQQEFLRRRQAFYVRRVMEAADSASWAQLREQSPGLLSECPTPGRKIEWHELASAAFPLFGPNVAKFKDNVQNLLDAAAGTIDEERWNDAARERERRIEEHLRQERWEAEAREREERRRQRAGCVRVFLFIVAVAAFVSLATVLPSDDPRTWVEPDVPLQNASASESTIVPDGCTRAVKPQSVTGWLMELPCQCGTICDALLVWVPIAQLLFGTIALPLLGCLNESDHEDWGFIWFCCAASICVCGWPLFTGPLASWVTSFVFGPMCSGLLASVYAVLPFIPCMDDCISDSAAAGTIACFGLIGFGCNLGINIYAWTLTYETVDDEEETLALAEYSCTAACISFHWVSRVTTGSAMLGLVAVIREGFNDGECDNCGEAMCWSTFGAFMVGLQLWPEITDPSTFATAGGWWLYPTLFLSIFGTTSLGGCGLALFSSWMCQHEPEEAGRCLKDYGLVWPLLCLPGALASMSLYLYRAGVPEYEGASSDWATVVHVGAAIFFILVILAVIRDDDDDKGWVLVGPLIFSAVFLSLDADSLQQIWILVVFGILFILMATLILLAVLSLAADGCFGGMPWEYWPNCARYSAGAGGVVMYAVGVVVLWKTFDASATADMPSAFMVSGAHEWHAGNATTVNGIYHLRVDLRDGVASDPSAETKCTDSWFSCLFESSDDSTDPDDLHIDGLTNECLTEAGALGSHIYQRHGDEPSPGLDSLLLYRPVGEHSWVIAPGRLAFKTCFASTAAYIYSIPDVCARRPDGDKCAGLWRQASPDGAWHATPNATFEPAAFPCEEGDMCCGVECAPAGYLGGDPVVCAKQFVAGAWAGVCANGTAARDWP